MVPGHIIDHLLWETIVMIVATQFEEAQQATYPRVIARQKGREEEEGLERCGRITSKTGHMAVCWQPPPLSSGQDSMATVVDTSSIQMTNCLSQSIHDYDMTGMFAIINRGIGGEPGPGVNRTITKPKNFVSLVSLYQTSTNTYLLLIFFTLLIPQQIHRQSFTNHTIYR